ncbi:DedA family protein [Mucisphaera sp.]|uniref:DedA family protein n=1 Tax=Mucisphaera sp. TaxID=2913024 RepID=UPI003D0B2C9D
METWLEQLAVNAPYVVLVAVLLASGFGLPVPEDIPLLIGGYLAGHGYAEPFTLFFFCFAAILFADATLFWLGRTYGHHIPRLPLLNRVLTEQRVLRAEGMLERHGGKFIFVGRFIPGVRAPAMFGAGALKVPYWKFALFDGSAAAISAPLFFFLGFYFADHLEAARLWILEGQILVGLVALIVAGVLFLRWKQRRRNRAQAHQNTN